MPEVYTPTLSIRMLGDFHLLIHDLRVSGMDVPRLQSLFAYLVLHHDVPQARARLASLLWPDSTEAQAHTNLRNLLHKLRATLPAVDTFLRIERQTLCWHLNMLCSLDVRYFEHMLDQAEHAHSSTEEQQALEDAVQLYQGDLLPHCYDDWIQDERERLQQLYVGALERLIELLRHQQKYQAAIRVAQRLLRHDPLQESIYQCLMNLYAARGDRGAVLRTYQSCVIMLKRELSVEPHLTTRQMYMQLMRAEN